MRISDITLASIFTVLLVAGSVHSSASTGSVTGSIKAKRAMFERVQEASKRDELPKVLMTTGGLSHRLYRTSPKTTATGTGEGPKMGLPKQPVTPYPPPLMPPPETHLQPTSRVQPVKGKSSITTSPETQKFINTIERQVEGVYKEVLFNSGTDEQRRSYGEYLISLGSAKLVEMINGAKTTAHKAWLLAIVLAYAGKEFIDDVFGGAELDDWDLRAVGGQQDLVCKVERFVDFLKRLKKKEIQARVVNRGVTELFLAKKTKYVTPLLYAIEREASLDKAVKDSAIKQAFLQDSYYANRGEALFAKLYYNHRAVNAYDYSEALYYSYLNDPTHKLFHWLLERADPEDLEEAKGHDEFAGRPREYREAIIRALGSGPRTMYKPRRE